MKSTTNTFALAGTLTIMFAFILWLGVSTIMGLLLAIPGIILFLIGAVQESEK